MTLGAPRTVIAFPSTLSRLSKLHRVGFIDSASWYLFCAGFVQMRRTQESKRNPTNILIASSGFAIGKGPLFNPEQVTRPGSYPVHLAAEGFLLPRIGRDVDQFPGGVF